MADSYARQGGSAHDVDDERPSRAAPLAELDGATPIVGSADPRLIHAGSSAPGLMALQRSAGNAAVAALVAPRTVQRDVQIGEMDSSVGVVDAAPAGATGAGGSDPVTSDGATTTITGGTIRLEAPMTTTGGVLQADTVIANNIVASNYTPGAGNVW